MFNILEKQKIINYFNRVYSWQNIENNKIDFNLQAYDYPIYLVSINEMINLLLETENELSVENIYEIEETENNISELLNSIKIEDIQINNVDLTLRMDIFSDSETHFHFTKHKSEWFCFMREKERTYFYFIGTSHKDIELETVKSIKEFLYNLKSETSLSI